MPKIGFLGNQHIKGHPTDQRLQAYHDTIHALGLSEHIYSTAFSDPINLKNMVIRKMLSDDPPDGIVATDDLSAILVLQEARQMGIAVPKDLKVIGFDGTQEILTYHSELSTIAQPIDDIATLLVKLLLERIEFPNRPLKQQQYTLPVKLIKSQTTA